MYVYLQPFATKGVIDRANHQLEAYGKKISLGQNLSMRLHYLGAAVCGVAQAVSYFALWVLTSLSCFATLALVGPLDRWSDETGSLTVASLMATAMALSSVIYLNAALNVTHKIIARVDSDFHSMVANFDKALEADTQLLRDQRGSLASGRGELFYPENYFDPAVKRMLEERRTTQQECLSAYPSEVNLKGAAFSNTKQRLERVAIQQTCELRATPCSEKEINQHLVQMIARLAEDLVAELYQYTIKLWASRIQEWGQRFNREAFCRNCIELFRSCKVTKQVGRLVRDVKEAEDKQKAFKDSEQKLRAYLKQVRDSVENMNRPWFGVRWWRRLYKHPRVNALSIAPQIDRYVDPQLPHFGNE